MRSVWIWIIIVLTLIPITADATAVSVTIYGTNKSNAQTNVTCYGCNNTISVQAWNTSYVKNISVNSLNASGDVVSFNISNVTAYQEQELKVNGTAINGYQAGANGMLNFSYNITGNKTLVLSPAVNTNGYNMTWAKIWNGVGINIQNSPTACVANTVYQNTNSTAMFVSYSTDDGATAGIYLAFHTDGLNPPSKRTWRQNQTNAGGVFTPMALFGVVLPNNYWMVRNDGPQSEECTTWT